MNPNLGFRWSDDPRLMTGEAIRRLLPSLAETGVGWLVLPVAAQVYPEARVIAAACRDAGLKPVLHLLPRGRELTPAIVGECIADWLAGGVTHVVVDDQPNRAERWARWSAPSMPQRYARWVLSLLEVVASENGVTPVFAPLAPRGDFRGLTFLREALLELRRVQPAWLGRLAVACVNGQQEHAVAWGKGGPALWGEEPLRGNEDEQGFFGWEWVQQCAESALGRQVSVLAVASRLNDGEDAATQSQSVAAIRAVATTAEGVLVASFPALGDGGWFRENGSSALPYLTAALRDSPPPDENGDQRVPRVIRLLHSDGRVETMALEEYLRGVVPAEIGAGSPAEALKAQAVAARCYAARAAHAPRHRNAEADICTTTHCQVWRAQTYPRTDEAIRETAGIVAYSEGRVIDALYFACCNGATKDSEQVWRNAVSYLRSVPCALKNQEQYGHGVGMCQRGAIQMARQGAAYQDILRHYYMGIRIARGAPGDSSSPAPSLPVPGIPPVSAPPSSPIRIERRTGVRAVAGNLRAKGVTVTVADPWGNQYRTVSGNKSDVGANGWEIVVPVDAVYRVTWADKQLTVPVRGDYVVIYEAI